jgi:hypothetical protein
MLNDLFSELKKRIQALYFDIIEDNKSEILPSTNYLLMKSDYAYVLILTSEDLKYICDNINKINEWMFAKLLDKEKEGKLYDAYIIIISNKCDENNAFLIEQNRTICRKYIITNFNEIDKISFLPLNSNKAQSDDRKISNLYNEFFEIIKNYENFFN